MTIDDRGNVYLTLGKAVTVFDRSGKQVAKIPVPENCTNVCFGGKAMTTLFITAGTSLYSIETKVKGAARQ
jgi:gluconolactonase